MVLNNKKIINLLIWGGLASPLVYSTQLYAGFAAPKAIFYVIIVLLLILFNKQYNLPKFNVVYGAVFIIILSVSSFFGLDFTHSFFSDPLRNTGVFLYLAITIWVLIVSQNVKEDKDWKYIFGIIGIVGCAIAIKGIPEDFHRPFSTIGNPSEAAAFVLLSIWCIGFFIFFEENKLKWLSILLIIPMCYYIYLTKTRSAFFALPLSLSLILVYYLYLKKPTLLRLLIPFLIIIIIGVLYLFPQFIQLGRLQGFTFDRLGFQKISINSFKEYPLLGIGLENFLYATYYHFDAELVNNHSKIDKAHSVFWEWIVSGGMVLFVFLLFISYKLFRKVLAFPVQIRILVLGFISSYFIWGFFSIDNISVLILVATLISFIVSKSSSKNEVFNIKYVSNSFRLLGLLLLVYVCLITENIYGLSRIRNSTDLESAKRLIVNLKSTLVFPTSTLEELIQKSENIEDTDVKNNFIDFLLQKDILFKSSSPHVLNLKTKLLSDIQKIDEALDTIEKSIKKAPGFAYSKKQYAVLLLQKNESEKASEVFEKFIIEYPNDSIAKVQLAAIQGIYLNNKVRSYEIIKNFGVQQKLDNIELISQIFADEKTVNFQKNIIDEILKSQPWMRVEKYALVFEFYRKNNFIKEFDNAGLQAYNFLLNKDDRIVYKSKFFINGIYDSRNQDKMVEFLTNHQFLYKD